MKKSLRKKNSAGFSLLEMVVACAIILFSIFAVMSLARKSNQLAKQALDETSASFLLEEGAEAVKIVRDNGWSNISSLTNGTSYYPSWNGTTWQLSATPAIIDNKFTRRVVMSAVSRDSSDNIVTSGGTLDSGTKKITASVSWAGASSTITKSFSFYVTNI